MTNRLNRAMKLAALCVSGTTLGTLIVAPTAAVAQSGGDKPAASAAATEDIIYTSDGRELHGKIISETRSQVIFEFIDQNTKIKSTITLDKDRIIEIKKGVPLPGASTGDSDAPAPTKTESAGKASSTSSVPATPKPVSKPADANKPKSFVTRVGSDAKEIPSFYIVPMKGQMGTDVRSELYKEIVEDIRAVKPSVVIITIDCQDVEDVVFSDKGKEELGFFMFDDYRELVSRFRNEIREFKQVCWVHDSVGVSSMVAMSWPEIYMTPRARFGGLSTVREQTGFDGMGDADVRGKMNAALYAIVKSFLEHGKHSLILADAMVRPSEFLSATWKGREVMWSLSTDGEYIVDNSDKHTVNFRSKDAEDFRISQGTAEGLDDLALLLGYREYRVADGAAERIVSDYIENWRRSFDDCQKLLQDYDQYMGWASGADEVKYLGRAKAALERVLSAIQRFPAVEVRMAREFGVSKQDLSIRIEEIQERLRAIKASNSRTAGGSGGRATGGGGRAGGGGRGGE